MSDEHVVIRQSLSDDERERINALRAGLSGPEYQFNTMPIKRVTTADGLVVIEVYLDSPKRLQIGRIPLSGAQARDIGGQLIKEANTADSDLIRRSKRGEASTTKAEGR